MAKNPMTITHTSNKSMVPTRTVARYAELYKATVNLDYDNDQDWTDEQMTAVLELAKIDDYAEKMRVNIHNIAVDQGLL